jgi:hypothetical protein
VRRSGFVIPLRLGILLLLFCAALSANAAEPNLAQYALRIKVVRSEWGRQSAVTFFYGVGEANLLLLPGAEAIDYQYADCQSPIRLMAAGHRALAARWKKRGKELEVLVPYSEGGRPIDPDKIRFTKCTLKVVIHDFVFVPRKASSLTVPAQEEDDLAVLSGRQVEHREEVPGIMRPLTTIRQQDYARDASLQALIEGGATPDGFPAAAQVSTAAPTK